MAREQLILVVARSTALASRLLTWLRETHRELVLVTTFGAAKECLATLPDLLITELKLQEYNGLHLALRSRASGIPALVIGPAEPAFARQAEALGVAYMPSPELDSEALFTTITRLLDCGIPPASTMASDSPASLSVLHRDRVRELEQTVENDRQAVIMH